MINRMMSTNMVLYGLYRTYMYKYQIYYDYLVLRLNTWLHRI